LISFVFRRTSRRSHALSPGWEAARSGGVWPIRRTDGLAAEFLQIIRGHGGGAVLAWAVLLMFAALRTATSEGPVEARWVRGTRRLQRVRRLCWASGALLKGSIAATQRVWPDGEAGAGRARAWFSSAIKSIDRMQLEHRQISRACFQSRRPHLGKTFQERPQLKASRPIMGNDSMRSTRSPPAYAGEALV